MQTHLSCHNGQLARSRPPLPLLAPGARGLGERPLSPPGHPLSLGQWAEWGLQLGSSCGSAPPSLPWSWVEGMAGAQQSHLTPVRPDCRGTHHWHWHCPGRSYPSRWERRGSACTPTPAPTAPPLLQARLALPAEAASPPRPHALPQLFLCVFMCVHTYVSEFMCVHNWQSAYVENVSV